MSRWFRFYAEALRNPKVVRLSDKEFRLWVKLMAVASENEGKIPALDDLKHVLSMRLDHLSTGVDRLISGGLIDPLDDGYEPHHWSKFQYKSDTSTPRVVKHRAIRNVSVTPPETDTDTEDSEPDGSGAEEAPDPASIIFGAGLRLMVAGGVRENQARSLLGKWRKEQGDAALIAALGTCKREGAINPTAFIEGIFRSGGNGAHQPNHAAIAGRPQRASPALALLREAEFQERAERDQAFGGGTGFALQALGSG